MRLGKELTRGVVMESDEAVETIQVEVVPTGAEPVSVAEQEPAVAEAAAQR